MVTLSFFSMERFDTLIQYSNDVDHTYNIISRLYVLEGYIKDLDRAERGYMLTRDTSYSNKLLHVNDSIAPAQTALKNLVKDDLQQKNLVVLRSIIALRIGAIRQNFAFMDTAGTNRISPYYHEGRKYMQECMGLIKLIHTEENKQLHQKHKDEQFYQRLATSTILYLLVIFFIITVLLFLLMVNELQKRRRYQDELQTMVVDLKRSNTELEQIAYAASHDLQEPLRKIQVFSNRYLFLKKNNIDADTKNTMDRINGAATRMQALIDDLMSLTSLAKTNISSEKTRSECNNKTGAYRAAKQN